METTDLADVRQMDFYNPLLEQCRQLKNEIRESYWQVVLRHYRMGSAIAKQFKPEYGQATMSALAMDLDISLSNLYRFMQFGKAFGSEAALEQYRSDNENEHRTITWTYIKSAVLPSTTEKPEKYGGVVNVAEETMMQVESLAIKVEELSALVAKQSVDTDTERELVGVFTKLKEVAQEAVSSVSHETPPPARIDSFVERVIEPFVEWMEGRLELHGLSLAWGMSMKDAAELLEKYGYSTE